METQETITIKEVLRDSLFGNNPKLAKEYGTDEITIDFQRNGNGKEKVDFMSYDPKKDIFKCYEIKVSMKDFNSNAKKSFCGDYNYLVLSVSLFNQRTADEWKNDIPNGVGIIVVNPITREKQTTIKSKRKTITNEQKEMLKNSMIRSLFYKSTKVV